MLRKEPVRLIKEPMSVLEEQEEKDNLQPQLHPCLKQACLGITIFGVGSACAVFLWCAGAPAACVFGFMGVIVILTIALPWLAKSYNWCGLFGHTDLSKPEKKEDKNSELNQELNYSIDIKKIAAEFNKEFGKLLEKKDAIQVEGANLIVKIECALPEIYVRKVIKLIDELKKASVIKEEYHPEPKIIGGKNPCLLLQIPVTRLYGTKPLPQLIFGEHHDDPTTTELLTILAPQFKKLGYEVFFDEMVEGVNLEMKLRHTETTAEKNFLLALQENEIEYQPIDYARTSFNEDLTEEELIRRDKAMSGFYLHETRCVFGKNGTGHHSGIQKELVASGQMSSKKFIFFYIVPPRERDPLGLSGLWLSPERLPLGITKIDATTSLESAAQDVLAVIHSFITLDNNPVMVSGRRQSAR